MVLLGIQSTTLAVTAVLTGVVLVFAALLIARLIGPRRFTQKKGETYECGIPTVSSSRGSSYKTTSGFTIPLHLGF